jgi:hypothetical protein
VKGARGGGGAMMISNPCTFAAVNAASAKKVDGTVFFMIRVLEVVLESLTTSEVPVKRPREYTLPPPKFTR